ncbi:MAG: oxygen-independent coproporphyrinogen III oxidase [Alphaproteobacteria bacterium]|nr:oxygen-independent coproporphyrinogen III oxidase [Alphaproteobacteria bacterium]
MENPLDWWNLEAPRYTSYPSAHHFSPAMDGNWHAERLAAMTEATHVSAYIHIPFCKELCWFCGCHTKMTKRYEPIARYVRVLVKELEIIRGFTGGRGKLNGIHFGGGSPSLLERSDLLAILYALASAFTHDPSGEFAMELDPRTTTAENIKLYAELGCNRVSIGIQDFNDEVQRAINRLQPFAMVASVMDTIRRAGIKGINCDLIYGLPHQTRERFLRTLEMTVALAPSRIALFSYAHMPHLKKHQRLIEASWLPSEREKVELYALAGEFLASAGYVAVGIDHFARPSDTLAAAASSGTLRRNFQGYVTDDTEVLVGVGSSAISQFPGGYIQNSANTPDYSARVERGILPSVRGWRHGGDDQARKHIIDELMCFMKADVEKACRAFALPKDYFADEILEIRELERRHGIIACEDGRNVVVTSPHRMAARIAASVFDRYRHAAAGKYSRVA